MNNFYEYSLIHANDYDAIVSATNKQTHDVRERFHPTCKLFTIPVGVLPDEQLARPHVAMTDRQPAKFWLRRGLSLKNKLITLLQRLGLLRKMSLTFLWTSMVMSTTGMITGR